MKILIDADGCPVVNITIALAVQTGLECLLLCDTSHMFEREGARTITVSKGADSVDFALVNMVSRGDIVVTQDYGLAAMCLARGALPIRQDGLCYTDHNIGALLHERHAAKKLRSAGVRQRAIAKRSAEDDKSFAKALEALISGKALA